MEYSGVGGGHSKIIDDGDRGNCPLPLPYAYGIPCDMLYRKLNVITRHRFLLADVQFDAAKALALVKNSIQ